MKGQIFNSFNNIVSKLCHNSSKALSNDTISFETINSSKNSTIFYPDIYVEPIYPKISSNISYRQNDILLHYFDMSYIAAISDISFVLSLPIKTYIGKYVNKEEEYQNNLQFVQNNFKKNIEISKKLDKYVKKHKIIFDKMREIYPDFCLHMEDKISEQDYFIYTSNKKSLKSCIKQTNARSSNSPSQSLLYARDKLSLVIDSIEFSQACKIEDQFFISELDKFFEELYKKTLDEQETFFAQTIDSQNNILSVLSKMKQKRCKRLKNYSEIEKIMQKLAKNPYIKIENAHNKAVYHVISSTDDDDYIP